MARKCQTVRFGGIGVQQSEQGTLPLFDTNRFAGAEEMAIHGEAVVDDVERTVAAAHGVEIRVPSVQSEKNFLVVSAGVFSRVDQQESELTGIGAAMQVPAGIKMGVIPSRSRGPRDELILPMAPWRHHGCAFLGGSIDIGGDPQSVPMDQLGDARLV